MRVPMQAGRITWGAYDTGLWGVSRAARRAIPGIAALLCAGMVTAVACQAQSRAAPKPKLPPGIDPGGVAIGLITSGIDYTRPEVARCLARDGEGELIGWDVVDRDRLPYQRSMTTVDGARGDDGLFAVVPCGRVRVVPVRVDPADGLSLGKALAFLAQSPAQVVVLSTSSWPQDWLPFRAAAAQFKTLLVVVAAGDAGRDLKQGAGQFGGLSVASAVVVSAAVPENGKLVPLGGPEGRPVDVLVEIAANRRDALAQSSPSSIAAVLSAVTLACSRFVADVRPSSGADLRARLTAMAMPDARLPGHAVLIPGCR